MNEKLKLIDRVLEQIQNDVAEQDLSSLAELLCYVPIKNLKNYLPEDEE